MRQRPGYSIFLRGRGRLEGPSWRIWLIVVGLIVAAGFLWGSVEVTGSILGGLVLWAAIALALGLLLLIPALLLFWIRERSLHRAWKRAKALWWDVVSQIDP